MKIAAAIIVSIAIFVAGSLWIGFVLWLIGAIASHARNGIGLMDHFTLYLMMILSPAIGAFYAVNVTSRIFRSLSVRVIYLGFFSTAIVFTTPPVAVVVYDVVTHNSSIGSTAILIFQITGIFLGVVVGKDRAEDSRAVSWPEILN